MHKFEDGPSDKYLEYIKNEQTLALEQLHSLPTHAFSARESLLIIHAALEPFEIISLQNVDERKDNQGDTDHDRARTMLPWYAAITDLYDWLSRLEYEEGTNVEIMMRLKFLHLTEDYATEVSLERLNPEEFKETIANYLHTLTSFHTIFTTLSRIPSDES